MDVLREKYSVASGNHFNKRFILAVVIKNNVALFKKFFTDFIIAGVDGNTDFLFSPRQKLNIQIAAMDFGAIFMLFARG